MQVGMLLGDYYVMDGEHFMLSYGFPTLEALENHIKLMLIAVQSVKEEDFVRTN